MPDPRTRNTRPLFARDTIRAIMNSWIKPQVEVFRKIAALRVYDDATAFEIGGFICAIDTLKNNRAALKALLAAADELEVRPKYEEVFQMLERMRAMDRSVNDVFAHFNTQQKASAVERPHFNGPTASGLVRRAL